MNVSGLREYQHEHAQHLAVVLFKNGSALDASDTGTGKTFVACALARQFAQAPLIICPLSVVQTWRDTLKLMEVEGATVVNYESARGASRTVNLFYKRLYGPFRQRHTESEFGYEVKSGRGSKWAWKRVSDFMIFDEVDRCAGETSLNSKMLIAARRQCGLILCLSATAASDPTQLKALGYTLGLFENTSDFKWWAFKHGCAPGVFGGIAFDDDPEQREKAMLKINAELFPARGSRLRKANIPNFPITSLEVRLVEDASGKAKKLSGDLAEQFRARQAQADNEDHHLTKLTRLRQSLEILKVPVLVDFALDFVKSSSVVLFVNYTETVLALQKKLQKAVNFRVPVISGNNAGEEREHIRVCFQERIFPLLIVNNAAGAVGLSLHDFKTQLDVTTLISPCYSVRLMKQVIGRVNRDGGGYSRQLFVYFAGTVEQQIAETLSDGFNNMDLLNDAQLNGAF